MTKQAKKELESYLDERYNYINLDNLDKRYVSNRVFYNGVVKGLQLAGLEIFIKNGKHKVI